MKIKNDYAKEIEGLKITVRWIVFSLVLWMIFAIEHYKYAMPFAFITGALWVVVKPVLDLAWAPIDRLLDRKISKGRLSNWIDRMNLRLRMSKDRDV